MGGVGGDGGVRSFELEYTRSLIPLSYSVMVSRDPLTPPPQDHYQHNVP